MIEIGVVLLLILAGCLILRGVRLQWEAHRRAQQEIVDELRKGSEQ